MQHHVDTRTNYQVIRAAQLSLAKLRGAQVDAIRQQLDAIWLANPTLMCSGTARALAQREARRAA